MMSEISTNSPAMRVNHFATFSHGGASTAAQRLHQALQTQGVDSRFLFYRGENPRIKLDRLNFSQPKWWSLEQIFRQRSLRQQEKQVFQLHNTHLANRQGSRETYGMARLPRPTHLSSDHLDCDLVHLHWLSFFVDYPSFFRSIPDTLPLVFTLHDMHMFTGGCHYSNSCARFQQQCGYCPQVDQPRANDVSRDSFVAKQNALSSKSVTVVGQNDWLLGLSRRSKIWPPSTHFHKIHLGIDVSDFRPLEPAQARTRIGVGLDSRVIAFAANDVANPRKGFRYLIEAIQRISVPFEIEYIVLGGGDLKDFGDESKLHRLGFVAEPARLSAAFSASDVLVVPSLEDNQPQVALEAMACGTPVVGFRSGGIPDFVRHHQTGLVADRADSDDLANCLTVILQNDDLRHRLGQQARKMIEREFESGQQARKYIDLYRDILSERTQPRSRKAA